MKNIMHIPYVNIAAQHAPIKDELLEAVGKIIDKGQFILGDEVLEFEKRFAELCGVRYAVGVNSGTDALILALKALGIGPGDEVITVANSFVASASCIALVGARPVFVDVRDDYNIDPTLIDLAITPRTKAILPVHLTGRPADMEPILDIAKHYNLHVVEDCAQAAIAEYKGKCVGGFGIIGCFSLHPLKTLNACGDGGILTTNDTALAERFKILRNVGLKSRDECITWSGNSRLDNIQAAMLLVKLNYLSAWTEKRRVNAHFYRQHLASLQRLKIPHENFYEKAVCHTFVIQADMRDELKTYLAECGIETAIHYPVPIHLDKVAENLGHGPGRFPVTERLAQRILSLPVYPELTAAELNYVVETIKKYYLEKS